MPIATIASRARYADLIREAR